MRKIGNFDSDFGGDASAAVTAIRSNLRFSAVAQQDQPATSASSPASTGSPAAVRGQPVADIPVATIFSSDVSGGAVAVSTPDTSASGQVPIVSVPAPVSSHSWLWLLALAVGGYWLYHTGHLRGFIAGVEKFLGSVVHEVEEVAGDVAREI